MQLTMNLIYNLTQIKISCDLIIKSIPISPTHNALISCATLHGTHLFLVQLKSRKIFNCFHTKQI